MFDAHTNFAVSTVAVLPSPAASGTSLTVASGEGVRFPAAPFNATIGPLAAQPTLANAEIVRVTARTGDVFTLARAQEGTTARTVQLGDVIAATITAKTLTDIETTVPTLAGTNVFTGANTFTAQQTLSTGSPILLFSNTAGPTDQKHLRLINVGGTFWMQALNDALSVVIASPLKMDWTGNVFVAADVSEKGRLTPMGHWIDVPFTAANFSGSGGMTWTVGAAAITRNRYCLIGNTMVWSLALSAGPTANSLTGTASAAIAITIPAGKLGPVGQTQLVAYQNAMTPVLGGLIAQTTGGLILNFANAAGGLFAIGAGPAMQWVVTLEVA
jgi:hypothetical protein